MSQAVRLESTIGRGRLAGARTGGLAQARLRVTGREPMQSVRLLDVRGYACRVDEWLPDDADGNGPPIVLLHGLLGTNEHWSQTARELAQTHRVVSLEVPVLDLEGRDCSVAGLQTIIEDLIREADIDHAIIAGNSLGGHVAAKLAIERPEWIVGLILMGASGLQERATGSEVVTTPSRDWLADRFGVMFHDRHRHMTDADLDRAFGLLSDRRKVRAFVRLCRSSRMDGLAEKLACLTMPTLLIWGRNDVVTPPEAAAGFARAIPHARIRWIDRCGHAPMIEHPVELAEAIGSFAESLAE